jgi:hypothetical protein
MKSTVGTLLMVSVILLPVNGASSGGQREQHHRGSTAHGTSDSERHAIAIARCIALRVKRVMGQRLRRARQQPAAIVRWRS